MKWYTVVVAAAVLLLAHESSAAKILGVFPAASKSHWAVCSSFIKVLGEAGHEVSISSVKFTTRRE